MWCVQGRQPTAQFGDMRNSVIDYVNYSNKTILTVLRIAILSYRIVYMQSHDF